MLLTRIDGEVSLWMARMITEEALAQLDPTADDQERIRERLLVLLGRGQAHPYDLATTAEALGLTAGERERILEELLTRLTSGMNRWTLAPLTTVLDWPDQEPFFLEAGGCLLSRVGPEASEFRAGYCERAAPYSRSAPSCATGCFQHVH